MHRNLPTLCVTVFFALTGIHSWIHIAPVYMRERLGAGATQVGFAFTVLAVAFRATQIVGGWLSDRFGRKRVLVAATLSMAPFYAAAGAATTWEGFLAALACCWMVGSLQWPSFLALVGESVGEARAGRAIAWLEFSAIAGAMVGPAAGALLLRWMPVGGLLHVTAAIYAIIGTSRGLLLVETRGRAVEEGGGRAPGRILALGLTAGFFGLVCSLYVWDGPFPAMYLRDVHHLDESAINVNSSLCGAAALATCVVAGRWVDRWGAARVMGGAFAGWALLVGLFFGAAHAAGYYLLIAFLVPTQTFMVAYEKLVLSMGGASARPGGRPLRQHGGAARRRLALRGRVALRRAGLRGSGGGGGGFLRGGGGGGASSATRNGGGATGMILSRPVPFVLPRGHVGRSGADPPLVFSRGS